LLWLDNKPLINHSTANIMHCIIHVYKSQATVHKHSVRCESTDDPKQSHSPM